jgi:hypothetical protein
MIPLLVIGEDNKKIVREAYCPECIFLEFPDLDFFKKAFMLEASNPDHDGVPFPIDYKTSACYSVEHGGFFAVRFNIMVADAHKYFAYHTPLGKNVIPMPQCFRCKNVKLMAFEKRGNEWYLGMKCGVINDRTPSNMVNIKCKNFEEI